MAYRLTDQRDHDPAEETRRRRKRRMRRKRATRRTMAVLPTTCTLANVICGFLAIFFASRPINTPMPLDWTPLTFGALFVLLGMLFDALDGRIARMTNNTSDLGEQLDSMADMVTFGVAPAFIAVMLVGIGTPFVTENANEMADRFALTVASIYVACTALRLARFNIETTSSSADDHLYFKGLPSPGAAGTVVSLVLLHQHFWANYQGRPAFDPDKAPWDVRIAAVGLLIIMLAVAFAMVSRLRYVHVLNRYVRGRAPFPRVVQGMLLAAVLAMWLQVTLASAFVVYAISAPVAAFVRRRRRQLAQSRNERIDSEPATEKDDDQQRHAS